MNQNIHYGDLPENLYIQLSRDFHKQFCLKIQKKIGSTLKNCFHTLLKCHKHHAYRLFTQRIRFRLDEFEILRKFAGILKQKVEKNIETIGMHEDGTIIHCPLLPFNLRNLFYVAAHLLFDGSLSKGGSYFYAGERSLVNYHKKRLHSFGKVTPTNYLAKENQLYFSRMISYITSEILDMHCFKSTQAILSNKMKCLAKQSKTLTDEIVKALIIDEGFIGDKIRIELNNEQLTKDLHEVIGKYYTLNEISNRKHSGYNKNSIAWSFIFKAESYRILHRSLFPLPIQHKSENLKWLNNIQKRRWYRNKDGTIKKSIVSSLLIKPKTMLELAKQLTIKDTTVRAHLKGHPTYSTSLIDRGIVVKIGNKTLKKGGYANPTVFGVTNIEKAHAYLNEKRV